jgi:hypothetical protein
MWYKAESSERPQAVDSTSSRKWVYIRRNITQEQREDGKVYVYDEAKIPKDMYDIIASQDGRLADLEDVVTELIGG